MGWDAGCIFLCSGAGIPFVPLLRMESCGAKRGIVQPDVAFHSFIPTLRRVLELGSLRLDGSQPERAAEGLSLGLAGVDWPVASLMAVPLHLGGSVVGILSIQSQAASAYSPDDVKLLQTLADHCGEALGRIQTRAALQKAEAKYRSIFENAIEGLFQTTPGGIYLSANPTLARILGFETAQELMASIPDLEDQLFVTPERRKAFDRILAAQGTVREFETEVYRKDRTKMWVSLNVRAVRDPQGTILFYQGSCLDITERKIAQQRLADALELNETILATTTIGILVYRASGACIFANGAAGHVMGAPVSQMLQHGSWREAFRQDPILLRMAEKAFATEGGASGRDLFGNRVRPESVVRLPDGGFREWGRTAFARHCWRKSRRERWPKTSCGRCRGAYSRLRKRSGCAWQESCIDGVNQILASAKNAAPQPGGEDGPAEPSGPRDPGALPASAGPGPGREPAHCPRPAPK